MSIKLIICIAATLIACNALEIMERRMAGGVSPIEDEKLHNEVVEMLMKNIEKLESSNWEVVEIERTAQQVVGGIKYFLYGTFNDKTDNTPYKATVTIYSRPWEDYMEIQMQDKVAAI